MMSADSDEEKISFLEDTTENQETALSNAQERGIKQTALKKALSKLNDRERDIILRRRLKEDPDTLEDLSQAYNISRERVRQIEKNAMDKIKEAMLANLYGDLKKFLDNYTQ